MPTIHHGDCIETMNAMPPESVDAIVCDPPYGLSNTTPAQVADTITKWASGDRDHVPTGRGFMGKSWDAFVPPPAVWDECLRVLKPGGHMVVFAGSRTQDLMGLSIRLAGFEMRDSLAWLYGSGFPKSHNVGKAIDKLAGAERTEVIGKGWHANTNGAAGNTMGRFSEEYQPGDCAKGRDLLAPATPEAAQWDGWGTALKPAFEPIVLARKPLAEKTVARNVLEHGTGAINVDACRIATEEVMSYSTSKAQGATGFGTGTSEQNPSGRWPANVVLDQHAAAWVDEQSGVSVATRTAVSDERGAGGSHIFASESLGRHDPGNSYADTGGASRFFYTAKAPKRERPNVNGVQHPTVKPLAVMEWLLRLVTPPGGTVLDPFAGSGTTIEAAMREGFDAIGIEMEADYLPLIQHRIDRQAAKLAV